MRFSHSLNYWMNAAAAPPAHNSAGVSNNNGE
jgi:hypothetical protein